MSSSVSAQWPESGSRAVRRYNDGICGLRVFSYPATKAVLHYKWSTWARRYLIVEMLDYFVWLIAFQAFVLLLQASSDPLPSPLFLLPIVTCLLISRLSLYVNVDSEFSCAMKQRVS